MWDDDSSREAERDAREAEEAMARGFPHPDDDDEPERTGAEAPLPGRISYRGANGQWYASQAEARGKYSWSD